MATTYDDESTTTPTTLTAGDHAGNRVTPEVEPDLARMRVIGEHMTRHFGKASFVYHELASEFVHVDVHVIPPTPERGYFTLYTTGMSDLPMSVPPSCESLRYAELVISLPASWPVQLNAGEMWPPRELKEERWYWPIRQLKFIARYPHAAKTWLGPGHTVTNGNPTRPFDASTRHCAMLLLEPVGVPDEGRRIQMPDGGIVHLYRLHAVQEDELRLKVETGLGALLDAFDRVRLSEVLDPARPSTLKKKRFGLF